MTRTGGLLTGLSGAGAPAGDSVERAGALVRARARRWGVDLRDGLMALYGAEEAARLGDRLLELATETVSRRSPRLLDLDRFREAETDWFQQPRMVGYAAYTERFGGTLGGVRERIDYLRELGITCLHLMPLLADQPGASDGGYAVVDYTRVRPDLGSVEDLKDLIEELAGAGISLELDVVLNHVGAGHPWASAARQGDPRYRDYFHWFADRAQPDLYERSLPEVFPRTAPGNFTWVDEMGAWVWTTFNAFQWDLNWSNPEVFWSFAGIMAEMANWGAEILRLDAIAFLWKRMGTTCQNQPEVHAIVRSLRAFLRIVAPAVVLNAEAIVGPADLVQYLGAGGNEGKLCDLAYHNSLMVHVWSMLATREVSLTARALRRLPPKPRQAAWVTYIRCHDDIGWAIDDRDAADSGLSGPLHRAFLADYYAGSYPGSPARGAVFQANEETGDRRTCGMTASLVGLDAAGTDTHATESALARVILAYSLILGWGGLAMVWMGDELAMVNDDDWAGDPAHGQDNRWLHRPHMDWASAESRADPSTVVGRVFGTLQGLIARRAELPQLHARMESEILEVFDPGVLAVRRPHPLGDLVGIYNVTEDWRSYPVAAVAEHVRPPFVDAMSGERIVPSERTDLHLSPYRALWLVHERETDDPI